MRYDGKNVLVVGYGESGKACEKFLRENGATAFVYDDYKSKDRFDAKGLDFAVVSPGISSKHSLLRALAEQGVPVLSEIDLAAMNVKSERILAVSGTNGKTTVCTILGKMLSSVAKTHVVGNIGVPFISVLSEITEDDIVVLEISSFQIEQSVFFSPYAACLTNVGEDHLDRHGSKDNYKRIKLSLLERASVSVKNADDPAQINARGVSYGCSSVADYRLIGRNIRFGDQIFPLPRESRGWAYDLDFLCAFALSSAVFSPSRAFVSCYDEVRLPPYRNVYVGRFCGARVFNDSKGTNIDATIFACSQETEPTALILGGSDKGENYARLSALDRHIRRIYLTGENASDIFSSVDFPTREKCVLMPDLESCLRHFASDPLSVLLFSPASASFDRYGGYEERGKHFDALLEKLGADLIR